jgi:hypothetical protein
MEPIFILIVKNRLHFLGIVIPYRYYKIFLKIKLGLIQNEIAGYLDFSSI